VCVCVGGGGGDFVLTYPAKCDTNMVDIRPPRIMSTASAGLYPHPVALRQPHELLLKLFLHPACTIKIELEEARQTNDLETCVVNTKCY
jgi:hypothetical protein